MWKLFRQKRVYLDYASAAPVLPAALNAMREAETLIGNPGAIHKEGVAAKRALEDARAHIAGLLGCKARGIIFTSGLTEANNLSIIGFARGLQLRGVRLQDTHWIVSSIEHMSVLTCFAEIERMGAVVSRIDPDQRGIIQPSALGRALRPETVFVSVGWANNEIGIVQPLSDIARTLRAYESGNGSSIIFHTDGGQAPLYSATSVHSLGVDVLSLGSNKLYGPHGIGCVYMSDRAHLAPPTAGLAPVILGGAQEAHMRAGTENVALAAGFAAAFEIVAGERESESKRLRELRGSLADELLEKIPGLIVNGSTSLTAGGALKHVLPHMLNVSYQLPATSYRTAEYVTLALDHAGIAVSTKSACQEGEKASHVIAALGGEEWQAKNTLRFSLGRETTAGDLKRALKVLVRIVGTSKTIKATP
ncbi:MAG: cysteine desulfurase family protein [Patescibacteria group bacterium]